MPPKYSTPSIDSASGGRPSAARMPAGNQPWKARLCTVITVAGRDRCRHSGDRPAATQPASHGRARRPADNSRRARRRLPRQPRQAPQSAARCRPIAAVLVDVEAARSHIEMRRIEHEEIEAGGRRREKPRRTTRRVGEVMHRRQCARACPARPDNPARVCASRRPARPAPREARRRHRRARRSSRAGRSPRRRREPAYAMQTALEASRSIIGCVIRQMPLSVRRKRCASRSGSSPTTRPSGMRTPRSTTTLASRALPARYRHRA